MTRPLNVAATLAALTLLATTAFAAVKPKVPPGTSTAVEPSVAIVGTGLDYTRPELAAALRRDAELEIVGWDFIDNDRRPFEGKSGVANPATSERNGVGTRLASVLANDMLTKMLLIPVRVDPTKPQSLALGIGFAARTSVRVVLVPNISANPLNWQVLLAAASEFPSQLFIVPADEALSTDVAAATWKIARALPNVIVVGGEQTGSSSDNRDKESWRTFIHIARCGNTIHHLQQNDKPLALGAVAAMAQLVLNAQGQPGRQGTSNGATGADLKRLLLDYIAADLLQQADATEKNWVASGFAKRAIEANKSTPELSSWRLVTGCFTIF
jgi:hypothetical protein